MDFAGILAFSSKKRRMISSNNERRPSGYSLYGLLMRQWSKNSQMAHFIEWHSDH